MAPAVALFGIAFEFDREAAGRIRDLYASFLASVEIPDSLLDPIRERFYEPEGGIGAASFRPYVDSYIDLYRLLEEIRFELALAALLLDDYSRKLARGEAPPRHESELPMPLPAESIALLLRFMREPPNPAELFTQPYSELAGHRILSDWFAGQLLDSVLVRAVAACDRLATLLWTRVEEPIRTTKAGKSHYPAFRREALKELAPHYREAEAWPDLLELTDHELFAYAKDLRDDFTHARRVPSLLHGEQFTVFAQDGEGIEGLDAEDHLAIGVAFYNEVIRAAIRLTGELLATKTKPPPPGGVEKLRQAREMFERSEPPD